MKFHVAKTTAMQNTLVNMMSNFVDLTEDEKTGILEAFPIKTYVKDSILLKQGQIARDAFVVIKGCVREFSLQDGEEITSEFYTELQSAVNYDSMANKKPSKYYFSCTEETTLAIMNPEKENALYKKFPHFGDICRVEMEKMMGAKQESFSSFKKATPKERYLSLIETRPDLLQRVPQYQIASYLGIEPETLSRIRKRLQNNT